jgi:hypothetical protein
MMKRIEPLMHLILRIAVLIAIWLGLGTSPKAADAWQSPNPGAPVTDLVIDAMEITQSVQDLNNSVPLVRGKRTFVRVYVHSTSGIHPTTATLKADTGLLSQTLLPIKPGGPLINVRPAYNRLLPSHAFLFELPLWATIFDELTLTATVNPDLRWHPHSPEEFSYANNSITKIVSFDPVPKLHLVIADQPYTFNNQTFTVRPYDRWKTLDWISRVYPLSNVKAYFRTLPILQAQRKLDQNNNWVLIYPSCSWLNLYMAYNRAAIFGNPFIPNTATFLGIAADNVGFMRGCAPINGMLTNTGYTRVASGPVGNDDWGWDFDGSYADWYGGHEVGHAWNQRHVRGGPGYVKDGCGGEAKAVKHYLNGSISPTGDIFDPTAIVGFDTLRLAQGINPILGPYWSDVMTYCDYQWMSKTTYMALKNMFTAYLPQTMEDTSYRPNAQEAAQETLAVFGELDPSGGEVSMLPVFVISSQAELTPPEPGPYAIVLYGAGGDELRRYPFTPGSLEGGPAPFEGNEGEVAYIALLLANIREIASLELEGPGGVLYQVEAGLNLPAVQVTSPNGSEIFGEEPITVSWTASDEDGDPLIFNVDYSADNGNSWEPVAQFITETQVTVEQVNLPASDMALFRVSASDGIHTSVDQSDGIFFIPNHPPTGEILAPGTDTIIASDQTITFQAQVYDDDLGALDEDNLQWQSDRDGYLGNGSVLSIASLSQGLHEINLVADDGQGQTIVDQVIVTVVSTPNDLPPQPNALVAGPDLVFLSPTAGVSSATLYLDNQNLGASVAWNVTSDQGWVNLSAYSGVAPQEITVSTSLTGRDFGTHKALLTFADPDGVYDPVYIVVVVTIPRYDLFLPIMVR